MTRVVDRIALGLFYPPRDVGYYQNAYNMYENAFLAPIDQLPSYMVSVAQVSANFDPIPPPSNKNSKPRYLPWRSSSFPPPQCCR
jgi:hypothetical protein